MYIFNFARDAQTVLVFAGANPDELLMAVCPAMLKPRSPFEARHRGDGTHALPPRVPFRRGWIMSFLRRGSNLASRGGAA